MNFFPKILKQKRIIFLCFLFLLFIGLTLPHIILATGPIEAVQNAITSGLEATGKTIVNGFLYALMLIPLAISALGADFVSMLLKAFMTLTTDGLGYTHNSAVDTGWPIVRDLANMIIVLGFVIIGIATALRIREYEAKQLLVKLIIVALLVNFSLLICGIFIDGTNIATKFFLQSHGITDLFNNSSTKTVIALAGNITSDNPMAFVVKAAGIIIFNLVAIIVFSLFAILFAIRIFALWILVILSPLAFVCYVFPFTKKIWDTWWSNFFQWCIISIPASFFIYLAIKMQTDMVSMAKYFKWDSLGDFAKSFTDLGTFIIPSLFLVAGFIFSLQISAMGGGLVKAVGGKLQKHGVPALGRAFSKTSGAAGKKLSQAGNYLSGTTIGKWSGAGFATKMMGKGATFVGNSSDRTQKLGSMFGRGLERIGAVPAGGQALADQAKVEAAAKLSIAAYVSGDAATKARVEDLAKNGTGIERAGAIQAIESEKKLHRVFTHAEDDPAGKFKKGDADLDAINNAITVAEKSGASRKIRKGAQESMPELSAYNKEAVNSIVDEWAGAKDSKTKTRTGGKINPETGTVWTEAEAMAAAPREAIRKTNADLGVPELRRMPSSQITLNTAEDIDNRTFDRASIEFTKEQIDKYRELAKVGGALLTRETDLRADEATHRAAGRIDQADSLLKKAESLHDKVIMIQGWR